jgi:hypothetical protein
LDRAGKPFFHHEQNWSVVGAPRRAPDAPASKLRIVDCGMRIEKGKQKNPKSAIRNPK